MVNPDRLSQLLDRYAAPLELYAAQWCSAPADVVQESFVRLVRQSPVPDDAVAWLYRVVRNGAISAGRSERRRERRESDAARPAWFTAPEGAALDAETATRALERLPLEQREVIVAHLWGGLSFQQIAELAGISSSTAHRRYEAGLRMLRERLGLAWTTNTDAATSCTSSNPHSEH